MSEKNDGRKNAFFRLRNETDEMIESHKHHTNNNRTDFVEEAVKYYCCMLDAKSNEDVLGTKVIEVIKSIFQNFENRQTRVQFKIAGELALINNLLAQIGVSLTDEQINYLRNISYDEVRKKHGFVKIEDLLSNE